MNKKGEAIGAAIFIFTFTLLLILYVLFIPDAEREALTGIGISDSDSSVDSGSNNGALPKRDKDVLLEVAPRLITKEGSDDFEYDLPSITLFKTTKAQILREENAFTVKNGWFTKQEKEVKFNVQDTQTTANYILSFNAAEFDGTLKIKLNENQIFEQQISTYSVQPIKLPTEFIQDGDNIITFSTSSVGTKFWTVNEYNLQDTKIIADITDLSRQEAIQTFHVPPSKTNIERATVKFVPECIQDETGLLEVYINNQRLTSSIPECRIPNSFQVPPTYLKAGANEISYITRDGSYLLSLIRVRTELEDVNYPTYYFNINEDQWDDIKQSKYYANLSFNFLVPEYNYIEFKINVNGDHIGVYQREDEFWDVLDEYLQEGNNVIRLIPEEDVDIISMKLEIERI